MYLVFLQIENQSDMVTSQYTPDSYSVGCFISQGTIRGNSFVHRKHFWDIICVRSQGKRLHVAFFSKSSWKKCLCMTCVKDAQIVEWKDRTKLWISVARKFLWLVISAVHALVLVTVILWGFGLVWFSWGGVWCFWVCLGLGFLFVCFFNYVFLPHLEASAWCDVFCGPYLSLAIVSNS